MNKELMVYCNGHNCEDCPFDGQCNLQYQDSKKYKNTIVVNKAYGEYNTTEKGELHDVVVQGLDMDYKKVVTVVQVKGQISKKEGDDSNE